MEKTFKQTIEIFSGLTYGSVYDTSYIQHKQLNDFRFITLTDFVDKTRTYKYPILIVSPATTDTPYKVSTLNRSFNVGILDMIKPDQSNLIDVYSDTEQIMLDIINILRNNFSIYKINLVSVGDLEPTQGTEFEDDLAGWFCEFEFKVPYNNNYCATATPVK